MSYYDVGDSVIYTPKNIKARIIRAWANDIYLVEFDDKSLIPPQMDVPGSSLKPDNLPLGFSGLYGWPEEQTGTYSDTNCRKCGGTWKETWIGKKAYYDCLKCNIKKEDQ